MYIIVNCAMSLDGRIEGEFSNEKDWKRVYELRAKSDAVMVGINTVLKDNPRLTTHGKGKEPVKIVVDSECRIPENARVLSTKAIIAVSEKADEERACAISKKAKVIVCGKDKVDLKALFGKLSETGINTILVEGGGTLISSVLDAGLADEINVAVAPTIFGRGVKLVEKEISGAVALELEDVIQLDDVVVLKYRVLK